MISEPMIRNPDLLGLEYHSMKYSLFGNVNKKTNWQLWEMIGANIPIAGPYLNNSTIYIISSLW